MFHRIYIMNAEIKYLVMPIIFNSVLSLNIAINDSVKLYLVCLCFWNFYTFSAFLYLSLFSFGINFNAVALIASACKHSYLSHYFYLYTHDHISNTHNDITKA